MDIYLRRSLCLCVFTFVSSRVHAQISNPIYDDRIQYENPLAQLDAQCSSCVEVYRVRRHLMPAVNHIYIGVKISSECPLPPSQRQVIYGASKGVTDRSYFAAALDAGDESHLSRVGRACGSEANEFMTRAVAISQRWQSALNNYFYLSYRILITPVLGRACATAAQEIILSGEGLLTP